MRKLLIILLTVIITCIVAAPVLAYVEDLESLSIPTNGVRVFRNLAETGDILYVFEYDIAFTSDNYSATPASDSMLFRLYDTDGTTLLLTTRPYVYPYFESNGYGLGVASFYFAAADANIPTWGDTVTIELYGTPAYFSPTQTHTYTVTTTDYSTGSTTDDERAEMSAFVLILCDRLTAAYSDQGLILKTTSDAGIVLSDLGEAYFRGSIPGIQTLCPDLFFFQVYVPVDMLQQDGVTYNMSAATPYTNRLAADDLGKGFTRLGELMGVSTAFAGAAMFIVIAFIVTFVCVKKTWGIEVGGLISTVIGIGFALLIGDIVFTLLMIASLLAALALVWLLLLRRA